MVFNLQQKLMSLSVPTPTAKELANQINTGAYNYKRLMWASIPEQLAKYLASSLAAGTFSATKAVEHGMIPQVATLIAGEGVPLPSIPGSANFTRAANSNILAALKQTKAGSADAPIAIVGDSTTAGEGAGTGATQYANCRLNGVTAQLRTALIGGGINASQDNFMVGTGALAAPAYTLVDSRVTISGSLTGFTAVPASSNSGSDAKAGPGGYLCMWISGVTGSLIYTPTDASTHCLLRYVTKPGIGTLGYKVDGGTEVQVNTAGADGIGTVLIDLGGAGAHNLAVRIVSGSEISVADVEFYNANVKAIRVINQGVRFWKMGDHLSAAQAWGPGPNEKLQGQKLNIINCTINNMVASADPAAAIADLTSLVNAFDALGQDSWIVSAQPLNPASILQATQDAYRAALAAFANARGKTYVDLSSDYANWTAWSGAALAYDQYHPNIAGAAYIANRYKALIAAVWAAA